MARSREPKSRDKDKMAPARREDTFFLTAAAEKPGTLPAATVDTESPAYSSTYYGRRNVSFVFHMNDRRANSPPGPPRRTRPRTRPPQSPRALPPGTAGTRR